MSVFSLLKKRNFLPLFLTQFFGAFNDNAFKLAMLTQISYFLTASKTESETYQAVAGGLFILPFFLFSATAGSISDKYDKALIARAIKIMEIALMMLGGFGFYFGNIIMMMFTLIGMGLHSTFFGPIKYAILPDHLPEKSLLGATALIEGSTFLAILLGTTLGTLSMGGAKVGAMYAIILTVAASIAGFIASLFIPSAPSSIPELTLDWCFPRATIQLFKDILEHKMLAFVLIMISWFWLIGAVVLTKLPDYTNYVLRAQTSVFALFLALFSIGIGIGALTVNYLLSGRVRIRYAPYILVILSLFCCDLYWATPLLSTDLPRRSLSIFLSQPTSIRIMVDLFLLAFFGGMFIVPLYTYLQVYSENIFRARTIAANNIVNALFMVMGTLFVMLLLYFRASIALVFFILGLLNACIGIVFGTYLRKNYMTAFY